MNFLYRLCYIETLHSSYTEKGEKIKREKNVIWPTKFCWNRSVKIFCFPFQSTIVSDRQVWRGQTFEPGTGELYEGTLHLPIFIYIQCCKVKNTPTVIITFFNRYSSFKHLQKLSHTKNLNVLVRRDFIILIYKTFKTHTIYTVRKFNWWRYCLNLNFTSHRAVSMQYCSVVSHIWRNPPELF